MATVVEGNFTAADQTSNEFVINHRLGDQARMEFDMLLGASTTGTVQVEVFSLGRWVGVLSITASGNQGIVRNATRRYRVKCLAYNGSGGIKYGIYT